MSLKLPTGFALFDKMFSGGLPLGSFIILDGPPGTKKSEFLYTMTVRQAELKRRLAELPENVILPDTIWYVALAKSKESVLRDIKGKFSENFYKEFSKRALFRVFWEPPTSLGDLGSWISKANGDSVKKMREEIISSLSKFLEREAPNSMIVLFTLNDLALFFKKEETLELLAFLESLREACRLWDFTILAVLTSGALDPSLETMIMSKADGLLSFQKSGDGGRRNLLVCEEVRGVIPEKEIFEIELKKEGVELKIKA